MHPLLRWLADLFRGCSEPGGVQTGPHHEDVPMRVEDPTLFNLTNLWDLTFDLLKDPKVWRERHITEIALRDYDYVEYSTAYQIHLPLELIEEHESSVEVGDYVRLLLPLAVQPKQLLFDLSFDGPEGSKATLLLRKDISRVQASYMASINMGEYFNKSVGNHIFLGVSAYTTSNWRAHKERTKPRVYKRCRMDWKENWRVRALVSYLNDDLDPASVSDCQVAKWLQVLEPARQALVEALGECRDDGSASECILLAVPFMGLESSKEEDSVKAIDMIVDSFVDAVMAMGETERKILAEYGKRWQTIVETVVPVGRSCTIKMSEQRPRQEDANYNLDRPIFRAQLVEKLKWKRLCDCFRGWRELRRQRRLWERARENGNNANGRRVLGG